MFVTILVFLLIIGILVFVHELGHFLLAKKHGVKVEEFAFGFRPRLFAKKVGETEYAINLIPLGGYVKLYGEGDEASGDRSLRSKTIYQRFQILVAGSLMNFILGFIVLTILFSTGFNPIFPGVNTNPYVSSTQQVVVRDISEGSPANIAGLMEGDIITSFNGEPVFSDQEFIMSTVGSVGQEVTITYLREGQEATAQLTPRSDPPAGEGPIGVAISTDGKIQTPIVKAPAAALWESGRIIGLSAQAFVGFVQNLVIRQEVSDDVTGLIGIGALTGVARRLGVDYLAQLLAIISIGLGVINLMPILPLDGGHIAALGYEKVARRPLSDKQLGILAIAGLVFVLMIFAIVTYKDIIRFDIIGRIF